MKNKDPYRKAPFRAKSLNLSLAVPPWWNGEFKSNLSKAVNASFGNNIHKKANSYLLPTGLST